MILPGSGGTVSFKYDPLGRRIYKNSTSGASVFAYDGDNLVEETNASGGVIARYTQGQGIDEPLAMTRSGTTSYYHADGLGSITSLSDSTGASAATYTFDSFGNLTAFTGGLTNPFMYAARELDAETGLYYYRARYFDSNAGRFISEDPIGFDADGSSFYTYSGNSPLSNFDPTGLARCIYVINGVDGGGWLDCIPDNPRNHGVTFPAASGNNGDAKHECKDNPACASKRGTGPIPPGWYAFGSKPGSHKHGGTPLIPIPCTMSNMYGRDLLMTHFCLNPFSPSRKRPYCSEGCITATKPNIKALNHLLTAEPHSTLFVGSISEED